MKCPYCGCGKTGTRETRAVEHSGTRRRRVCTECGKKFTTYEFSSDMLKLVAFRKVAPAVLSEIKNAAESAVKKIMES